MVLISSCFSAFFKFPDFGVELFSLQQPRVLTSSSLHSHLVTDEVTGSWGKPVAFLKSRSTSEDRTRAKPLPFILYVGSSQHGTWVHHEAELPREPSSRPQPCVIQLDPPRPVLPQIPPHPWCSQSSATARLHPGDRSTMHLLVELLRVLWWQALGSRKVLLCASTFPDFSREDVVEASCKTVPTFYSASWLEQKSLRRQWRFRHQRWKYWLDSLCPPVNYRLYTGWDLESPSSAKLRVESPI